MSLASRTSHAERMDGIYRTQRHIYDLTRKYYLLGRDRMIDDLAVPPGGSLLEIGCGTGRNLLLAAQRYPQARLFGLDISAEMLETAAAARTRHGLDARLRLAQADATDFDPRALFGCAGFDRVFISYALSMIPGWQAAVAAGVAALNPGGSLHIADFGRQDDLPDWFKSGLRSWLARFHVTPRDQLREALESECRRTGASLSFDSIFRGYSVIATVRKS